MTVNTYINRALRLISKGPSRTLDGDRAIEWSWVVAHLPERPSKILDVGSVQSALTAISARLGHHVTSVDQRPIEYRLEGVEFIQKDIRGLSLQPSEYDVIINCSTIEHVGLLSRYSSKKDPNGDITVMSELRNLLKNDGAMILTIPVGNDAVIAPWHRIYGERRLSALLSGYTIVQSEYWHKTIESLWEQVGERAALAVAGNEHYYALGLYMLKVSR